MADQIAVEDPMRDRILRATFKVLCRHGYGKFNLSDVAAQAGISRPTLYKSFSSKDELLAAFSQFELQLAAGGLGAGGRWPQGAPAARRSAAIFGGLLRLLPDARPHRDRTWPGARPDGGRVAHAGRVDRGGADRAGLRSRSRSDGSRPPLRMPLPRPGVRRTPVPRSTPCRRGHSVKINETHPLTCFTPFVNGVNIGACRSP